jgi:hypothetical protein
MNFQAEFYLHIICGHAGDAAPVLARLALSVGHDAQAYPFPIENLNLVGRFKRASGTQGLNEFYAMECARAVVLRAFKPWRADQIEQLESIAKKALPPSLDEQFPLNTAGH